MDKSREVYISILRKMAPERRFTMAADLIGAQFDAMKAGIKFRNPGAGEAEIDSLFKERLRRIYSLKL